MRHFKLIGLGALLTVSAFTALPVQAANREETLTLDSRDLTSLQIFAGVGSLEVQGVDNIETIEVIGKIVGGNKRCRFTLKRDNDVAVLVAMNSERHFIFEWLGETPRIDVTIKVPSRMRLDVRDGAGGMSIAGMKAAAIVVDDNGDLRVSNHEGNLQIYDGNGRITVDAVKGHLSIIDGNGHIAITSVVGNVDINDGNGSIVAKNITGRVAIHDGNGGVAATNVTQGVTINDGRAGRLAMAIDGSAAGN